MDHKIRWGILGTGNIAQSFAEGLSALPDAEVIAVGSRSITSAHHFANRFNVPHRHASYQTLVEDPEVDVIYIATPHPLHKENCLLCLEAGKAVLCEKPFTLNAAEALEVITAARTHRLFLMEAMWTRFLPAMAKVRELLAAGTIGELRMITADFGFRAPFDPSHRLFAPELGGGALLDVGIYPLSLTSMLLGAPSSIVSMAHLGETGVDEQSAVILGYPEGQLALLYAATRTQTPIEATLMGTEGSIKIHTPMYKPTQITLSVTRESMPATLPLPIALKSLGKSLGLADFWRRYVAQKRTTLNLPFTGNGYNYEAAEVMQCLRDGKIESEIMPLDETLAIMKTMDAIRAQWGLRYTTEGKASL